MPRRPAGNPLWLTQHESTILKFIAYNSGSAGYAIKKSTGLTNPTIYRALSALHKRRFLTKDTVIPEKGPARYIYTITKLGQQALDDI